MNLSNVTKGGVVATAVGAALGGALITTVTPTVVSALSPTTYVMKAGPTPKAVDVSDVKLTAADITRPAIGLTISPYHVIGTHGQRHLHQTITVLNDGRQAVHVRTGFQSVRAGPGTKCGLVKPPSWAHITPATLTLKPGQRAATQVTVNAPASATGHYDLTALDSMTPVTSAAAHANTVTGAVGARVLINLPGATTSHPCEIAQPHYKTGPASPWPAVGVLAGLAVLLAALVRYIIRRRRRKLS